MIPAASTVTTLAMSEDGVIAVTASISGLLAAVLGAGITAWALTRSSRRTTAAADEAEDHRRIEALESRVDKQDLKITALYRLVAIYRDYAEHLRQHIWDGKPPPPPDWPPIPDNV